MPAFAGMTTPRIVIPAQAGIHAGWRPDPSGHAGGAIHTTIADPSADGSAPATVNQNAD